MRVDFYILDTPEHSGKLQFACRLTEKAYTLSSRVHAHTASAAEAKALDDMLWTFRQGSFVPHELLTAGTQPRAPVTVGTSEHHPIDGDLLINLDRDVPDFSAGFERIAEVIGADEASRQAGRERFRQYRERGIEPETHKIGA